MHYITLLGVGLVSGQTVEERLAALEERVTKLEANLGKPSSQPSSPVPVVGAIFFDGFEAGVSNWKQETFYHFSSSTSAAHIATHEKMRAAKELIWKNGKIECPDGKRFFTLASDEKGVVVSNNASSAESVGE